MAKSHVITYTTKLHQFDEQGEKTGWTYIIIPSDIAEQIRPGSKTSFRVKGLLDKHPIKSVAVMPMGNGDFVLPFNKTMRSATGKRKGAMIEVNITLDSDPLTMPDGFEDCLNDEPAAKDFFNSLKRSHQNYFIKWMGGVKSDIAKAKRMAVVITALSNHQDFVTMIRSQKK